MPDFLDRRSHGECPQSWHLPDSPVSTAHGTHRDWTNRSQRHGCPGSVRASKLVSMPELTPRTPKAQGGWSTGGVRVLHVALTQINVAAAAEAHDASRGCLGCRSTMNREW